MLTIIRYMSNRSVKLSPRVLWLACKFLLLLMSKGHMISTQWGLPTMGCCLNNAAKPVKQELQIEIVSFFRLLQFLELIKSEQDRQVVLCQDIFQLSQPFIKQAIGCGSDFSIGFV